MFLVNEPYRWVNVPGESHSGPHTFIRASMGLILLDSAPCLPDASQTVALDMLLNCSTRLAGTLLMKCMTIDSVTSPSRTRPVSVLRQSLLHHEAGALGSKRVSTFQSR